MEPVKVIECNDDIMLQMFEMFLANPRAFTSDMRGQAAGRAAIDSYVAKLRQQKPQSCSETRLKQLRWHAAALLSEFVVNGDLLRDPNAPEHPLNHLNWSGKKLYARLKGDPDRAQ